MSKELIQILSFGAGVQSTTVLLMSHLGELPPLDFAIFSDTQWEPLGVYEHLNRLAGVEYETWETDTGTIRHRAKTGVYTDGMLKGSPPLVVVSKGDLRDHSMTAFAGGSKVKGQRCASMPLFTLMPNGSGGMIRRQCTREYKIEPVEKYIKAEILGIAHRGRWPKEDVGLFLQECEGMCGV